MYFRDDVQARIRTQEPEGSELSQDRDDRLDALAVELADMELAAQEPIQFVMRVVRMVQQYRNMYGEWLLEDASRVDQNRSIREFALEKTVELRADRFEEEYELKVHAYALGQLAEVALSKTREYVKNLWNGSASASPESHDHVFRSPESHQTQSRVETPGGETQASNGMAEVLSTMATTMAAVTERLADMHKEKADSKDAAEAREGEKMMSITGMKIQKEQPTIDDKDPDLDRYIMEINDAITTYEFG